MLSSTTRMLGRHLGKQAFQALSARVVAGGIAGFSSTACVLKDHIVVALGGNALLKRGEAMTVANQQKNIQDGISSLKGVVADHTVTIVHGNGPQVGLLLLESAAYQEKTGLEQISLDVLDAETEGMIGYMIEQELQKYLAPDRGMVTILSQIVCDPNDPAMANPTKFVGPVYTKEQAIKLLRDKNFPFKPDGDYYRRVVPSPLPVKLMDHQMKVVQQLTAQDCVVICAGGGGIPVVQDTQTKHYTGIEAVIDKDRSATMMAQALDAQGLLILTDVPAVATHFGQPNEKWIKTVSPVALQKLQAEQQQQHFPAGSMGPKVESAIEFVSSTSPGGCASSRWAAIGSLSEAEQIVAGQAGTIVRGDLADDFIEYYPEEDSTTTATRPLVA